MHDHLSSCIQEAYSPLFFNHSTVYLVWYGQEGMGQGLSPKQLPVTRHLSLRSLPCPRALKPGGWFRDFPNTSDPVISHWHTCWCKTKTSLQEQPSFLRAQAVLLLEVCQLPGERKCLKISWGPLSILSFFFSINQSFYFPTEYNQRVS